MDAAAHRQALSDIDEAIAITRELSLRDLRAQLADSKRRFGLHPALIACYVVIGIGTSVITLTASYAFVTIAMRPSIAACGH